MYFLYSLLTAAGMALLAPYFFVRGLRRGNYSHHLRERFGSLPGNLLAGGSESRSVIWIHAVSVGEVLAARPLALELKKRYPQCVMFVSTTTDTGQRLARDRLDFADGFFYFPLDWTWVIRRVLRQIRPTMVIILETEIWPNFLREAQRIGAAVVFVNARISDRSIRRARRVLPLLSGFFSRVLAGGTLYLTQSDADAKRLEELGAPAERVEVTGNMKFDAAAPAIGPFGVWLKAQTTEQERWPIVVAGSVVADEEEAALGGYDVVQRQWRRALLVLAPRKPERFDIAARLATERGWKVARRSALDLSATLSEDCDVLLLDSIGELAGIYSLADAVFVGGSLVPSGGHNILEPAWFGRPPVFGPHMENFRDMAQQFRSEGAGVQVRTSEQLGKTFVQLIRDEKMCERMGRKAQEIAARHRGATARSLERIATILEPRLREARRSEP